MSGTHGGMFASVRWALPEGNSKQQFLLDPNSALVRAEASKYNLALISGENLESLSLVRWKLACLNPVLKNPAAYLF